MGAACSRYCHVAGPAAGLHCAPQQGALSRTVKRLDGTVTSRSGRARSGRRRGCPHRSSSARVRWIVAAGGPGGAGAGGPRGIPRARAHFGAHRLPGFEKPGRLRRNRGRANDDCDVPLARLPLRRSRASAICIARRIHRRVSSRSVSRAAWRLSACAAYDRDGISVVSMCSLPNPPIFVSNPGTSHRLISSHPGVSPGLWPFRASARCAG